MIIKEQKQYYRHKYLRGIILFLLHQIKQLENIEKRLVNILRRIDLYEN